MPPFHGPLCLRPSFCAKCKYGGRPILGGCGGAQPPSVNGRGGRGRAPPPEHYQCKLVAPWFPDILYQPKLPRPSLGVPEGTWWTNHLIQGRDPNLNRYPQHKMFFPPTQAIAMSPPHSRQQVLFSWPHIDLVLDVEANHNLVLGDRSLLGFANGNDALRRRASLHWNSTTLAWSWTLDCISEIIWMFLCTLVLHVSLASLVFSLASAPQDLWCIAHDIYFGLRPLPSVPSIAYGHPKCKHGFWSDSNTSWLPK